MAGWVGTELPVSKIRAGTNGCHLMVNDRNAGPLEPPTYIPNYLPPHLSLLPSHFTPKLPLHCDRKAGMVDQVRGRTNRGDLMVNGRHRHRAPFYSHKPINTVWTGRIPLSRYKTLPSSQISFILIQFAFQGNAHPVGWSTNSCPSSAKQLRLRLCEICDKVLLAGRLILIVVQSYLPQPNSKRRCRGMF